jgi:hypothetical protein
MTQKFLLVWLIAPLLFGCAGAKQVLNGPEMIETMDLSTYRVVDASGSNQLSLLEIIADGQTGKIDYLVIRAPLSGFDIDIRTTPFRPEQVILIPLKLATINIVGKQIKLQVGMQEVNDSPYFSLPIDSLPENWRKIVDQYWYPRFEKRNELVKK